MCNNRTYKFNRILRLNWLATGDPARPLRARWSLQAPGEPPSFRADDLFDACNAAVIEAWETALAPRQERKQLRPLTMCRK